MAVPQQPIIKILSIFANNPATRDLEICPHIFSKSDATLLHTLTPVLRRMAVQHLSAASSAAAKLFRGEFISQDNDEYKKYLTHQAQAGVNANDAEAAALGEVFALNIVVTSVYPDRSDSTWCLHLESEYAQTVHLYKYAEKHWTNSPKLADETCLYKAFARALRELTTPKPQKTALSSNSLFKEALCKNELKRQVLISKAISTAINNQQLPAEKEIAYIKEQERLGNLSMEVRNRIALDYAAALDLARSNTKVKTYDVQTEDESQISTNILKAR